MMRKNVQELTTYYYFFKIERNSFSQTLAIWRRVGFPSHQSSIRHCLRLKFILSVVSTLLLIRTSNWLLRLLKSFASAAAFSTSDLRPRSCVIIFASSGNFSSFQSVIEDVFWYPLMRLIRVSRL